MIRSMIAALAALTFFLQLQPRQNIFRFHIPSPAWPIFPMATCLRIFTMMQ